MMKEGSMNIKMGTGRIEVGYPGSVSGSGAPKRLSANSSTLCGAEWSWSPAHSRADTYSLHSGRRDWFLWLSYLMTISEGLNGTSSAVCQRSELMLMPQRGLF